MGWKGALEIVDPEPVSEAVGIDGLDTRIDSRDLEPRSRSGVAAEYARHILTTQE